MPSVDKLNYKLVPVNSMPLRAAARVFFQMWRDAVADNGERMTVAKPIFPEKSIVGEAYYKMTGRTGAYPLGNYCKVINENRASIGMLAWGEVQNQKNGKEWLQDIGLPENTVEIGNIVVRKKFRGLGLMAFAISELEKQLKQQGYDSFLIRTAYSNLAMRKTARKAGYKKIPFSQLKKVAEKRKLLPQQLTKTARFHKKI